MKRSNLGGKTKSRHFALTERVEQLLYDVCALKGFVSKSAGVRWCIEKGHELALKSAKEEK